MMADFMKGEVLGRVVTAIYTIEFQKRGLPHAHIVLWLAEGDKSVCPEEIDYVVSAEIPDKETDPIGYESIAQFMIHDPCGAANPRCACMMNGKCNKLCPKSFSDVTTMDENGYALYRRHATGRSIECNKIKLDHRHVVPYNHGLLVKYQAHINIERCNRSQSIKYLFKYIGKGPDTVTAVMERTGNCASSSSSNTFSTKKIDEVKNHLSCRYVSAVEASWRIFKFPIHFREPFVQHLYFHLEDEQEVRFHDNDSIPEVVDKVNRDDSMFVQWLISNRRDGTGRDLTFVKYPTRYRWDSGGKFWARRLQNVSVVGQLVYAHPASGERFYMRMLLNPVVGARSFKDIRTVNSVVCTTYKDACFQRGLLHSDKEWHVALQDASNYATAPQLRDLFVTMLIFCGVSNPADLWEKHWATLADDMEYTKRKLLGLPTLIISNPDKQTLALEAINDLLKQPGKSLSDFPELPKLNSSSTHKFRNQLLLEEMLYDCHQLQVQAEKCVRNLNRMQRMVFDEVMHSVATGTDGLYFVYSHGGTGKTIMW
ncbi:hypothetical protein AgCh_009840 [Apium graveolens]